MGIKLGTLYPDGHCDDLGEANGGFIPGADSARRAEEYGWEQPIDTGSEYLLFSKTPEETGDMRYMFCIRCTDMSQSGRREDTKIIYLSDLLEGGEYETEEACIKALLQHPDREQLVLEWHDDPEIVTPTDQQVLDWARDNFYEAERPLIITELYVVPVSMIESQLKRVLSSCGLIEKDTWDGYQNQYREDGDWRSLAYEIVSYGYCVPVGSWSSYPEAGEWPQHDVQSAKMAALQVHMLLGFYMDRRMNALGETGWDWLRNSGVIFCGDEVIDTRDGRYYTVEEVEKESLSVTDEENRKATLPLDVVKTLDTWERIRRAKDLLSKEQAEAEEEGAGDSKEG